MTPAPGLLIAAPRSGSGKTTVTLGLQRALARRGVRVRGFKCGPDYIDPAFHEAATGRASYNLDSFAMPPALLGEIGRTSAADCDIVIAEGSMGLFDGVRAEEGRTGANADIAAAFGWPVVLVLDCSGQAQTAAATALGLARYDPRIRVAGVVLNRVASERHRRLAEAGFQRTGLPVLGALMRDDTLALPERHLGLVQAGEHPDLGLVLDRLADRIEAALDLETLVALAAATHLPQGKPSRRLRPPGQRIALARDRAFSFVYPHLIDGWRRAGAEITPFSPLADEAPPDDCDACWLPGGYPELHAGALAGAYSFMSGLRRFAESRPVHGECGGYMALGETLTDGSGVEHRMAGLLPVRTSFASRKLHLGYRNVELLGRCAIGEAGARLVGHEFHYASVTEEGGNPLTITTDAEGALTKTAGHSVGWASGTFFHLISAAEAQRATSETDATATGDVLAISAVAS